MELIDYMKNVEQFSLKSIGTKLREILESVIFLSDCWLLTEEEIDANNLVFQWYHKMPEILENNKVIIENKTQEFQDLLRGTNILFTKIWIL